jgi:hypothetical protein
MSKFRTILSLNLIPVSLDASNQIHNHKSYCLFVLHYSPYSFSAPGRCVTHFEFSDAFHLFPHALLLRKPAECGPSPADVTCFHSYLTCRISHVRYRETLSTSHEVLSAVPQGSVLGPLLFSVVTNDLDSVAKCSYCLLFGDDVKTYREIKSPFNSWLLQSDTNNIRVWCILNYMKLNINKDGFGGLVVSMLASGSRVRGFKAEAVGFLTSVKNPQHAFLRRGSKRICPMSQICGM